MLTPPPPGSPPAAPAFWSGLSSEPTGHNPCKPTPAAQDRDQAPPAQAHKVRVGGPGPGEGAELGREEEGARARRPPRAFLPGHMCTDDTVAAPRAPARVRQGLDPDPASERARVLAVDRTLAEDHERTSASDQAASPSGHRHPGHGLRWPRTASRSRGTAWRARTPVPERRDRPPPCRTARVTPPLQGCAGGRTAASPGTAAAGGQGQVSPLPQLPTSRGARLATQTLLPSREALSCCSLRADHRVTSSVTRAWDSARPPGGRPLRPTCPHRTTPPVSMWGRPSTLGGRGQEGHVLQGTVPSRRPLGAKTHAASKRGCWTFLGRAPG